MISLLIGVAACAPTAPLYAPIESGGGHGYKETRLGLARFQVMYTAPSVLTFALTKPRQSAEAEDRLALAYDLALWRASELALQNGYVAFAVADRSNDVFVDVRYDYGDPFYGPCRRPFTLRGFDCGPYPYRYPYRGDWDRYSQIEARVTLTIDLKTAIEPGLFDARDAIAKLRAQYPNALVAGKPLS